MPDKITVIENKINKVKTAWSELAGAEEFGGMTLSQFTVATQPSLAARGELDRLDAQMTQWQNRRDNADKVSAAAIQKVVKGVAGDSGFGEDCDLYEAMGYVRKSERKTGLTKKKSSTPPA